MELKKNIIYAFDGISFSLRKGREFGHMLQHG